MSKEAYEQKKRERLKKKEEKKRKAKQEKIKSNLTTYISIALVLIVVVFGIYWLVDSSKPTGEDFSQKIEIMEESHIAPGSVLPEYNSNPPTSGPHYTQTAEAGYRTEEIEDQYIIHNLEHGDIWISYKPSVSSEVKEALKQFDHVKVIITPREANDMDIAIAAWGRLDKFNLENDELPVQRINDFIARYANQGPEKIPGKSQGI
ncbi:MAG: DUF3105 domain-containing protein [Candidatus Spechtbacterales bacterium]|nr:DUF3105 domain-containing protein [Candidatus Spechtbacterales bacterium]